MTAVDPLAQDLAGNTALALIDSGAEFSPDRRYRYRLWRRWGGGPMLMVIGLNPSTADEVKNDPTVTRCIGYAKAWGFSGLLMTNVFAYRATDPRSMKAVAEPCGPGNMVRLSDLAVDTVSTGGAVLAAWGDHGRHMGTGNALTARLHFAGIGVACLGLTKFLQPKHPLYQKRDARPMPFLGDGGRLCVGRDGTGHGYHVEGR